jgi:hypothetical protein
MLANDDSSKVSPSPPAKIMHPPTNAGSSIDAGFQGMAEDEDYQSEAMRIMEQFAASDAETLAIVESYRSEVKD